MAPGLINVSGVIFSFSLSKKRKMPDRRLPAKRLSVLVISRFGIARGRERGGEAAMVLVRFEYLRSDSERKLLIGQFDLTHVK